MSFRSLIPWGSWAVLPFLWMSCGDPTADRDEDPQTLSQEDANSNPSEGEFCTEIGCPAPLWLVFDPALTDEGSYELTFRGDTESVTCTVVVPTKPLRYECSAGNWSIRATRDGGIDKVASWRAPEEVELMVRHEGRELFRSKHTPTYTVSYPNGEGCDPGCKKAEIQVAW